jgi:hypothetical protein
MDRKVSTAFIKREKPRHVKKNRSKKDADFVSAMKAVEH